MSNRRFQNVLTDYPQKTPPIWFMRQAGRYHQHYQKLKEKYDFMTLCKEPDLAAEVAMGPIEDFDFDVAILFSDLLFPLEALGMELTYDPGPKFAKLLSPADMAMFNSEDEAIERLAFQKRAVELTRSALPDKKSLIGFVGGPWTLFTYAISGGHDGHLLQAKSQLEFYKNFARIMVPLLIRNIELQLEGGAEVVMVFDTAAGEVSPTVFNLYLADHLNELAAAHPGKLGYYSKGTQKAHLESKIFTSIDWAGYGVDHRWDLPKLLKQRKRGFLQGNFDQALLFSDPDSFKKRFYEWLGPFKDLSPSERKGWVCGLGHGVLPKTPESNVRSFIELVRKELG